MTTRADIVIAARTWLGVRWAHQACLPNVACDCLGLVMGVARQCGIAEAAAWFVDPLCKGYGHQPDPMAVIEVCARYLDPVEEPIPGDVLLLRFERAPIHFAILSAPGRMVHAYAHARRVVEHGIDEQWQGRIVAAYSFRGVT